MMKKTWIRIQALLAFMALVRDPNQTDRIFKIGDLARKELGDQVPPGMESVFASAGFQALYAEQYHPWVDLSALRKLPEHTFGGAVARFLDLNGFEPNAFPAAEGDTAVAYFSTRARQTHDFWHVLTGYGTGVPSELALQGFMMSQIGATISAIIVAGGILHTIFFKPLDLKSTFALIVEGYQRGKLASPLIEVKWEELWNEELSHVRLRFGLHAETVSDTLFLNGQESYHAG